MKYLLALLLCFLALNVFGILFATGESFPVPIPKTTTITVPFNGPIH
jgi:hypothetical protein